MLTKWSACKQQHKILVGSERQALGQTARQNYFAATQGQSRNTKIGKSKRQLRKTKPRRREVKLKVTSVVTVVFRRLGLLFVRLIADTRCGYHIKEGGKEEERHNLALLPTDLLNSQSESLSLVHHLSHLTHHQSFGLRFISLSQSGTSVSCDINELETVTCGYGHGLTRRTNGTAQRAESTAAVVRNHNRNTQQTLLSTWDCTFSRLSPSFET